MVVTSGRKVLRLFRILPDRSDVHGRLCEAIVDLPHRTNSHQKRSSGLPITASHPNMAPSSMST